MEINLYRIGQVIEYIEENLKETVTLDDVAEVSGISPYYLHRIFKSLTGYPLVQYIRNRKLSQSVSELLDTQMPLLDIAQEYGFEYQQSYSRAFKRYFLVSPGQFRKRTGAVIDLAPRLDLSKLRDAGGGILRLPVYRVKKEFYLIGIRGVVADNDNYENATANRMGVDFFYRHAGCIPNPVDRSVYYSYIEDIPGTTWCSWYQPSLEVADLSCIPTGMRGVTVPTRRYAVFTYIGGHSPDEITFRTILDLQGVIFRDWIALTRERITDPFHIERINSADCGRDYCKMDIYIPVAGISS